MAVNHQEHYTQQYDPALVSRKIDMITNWVVLTGSSCCGKTTMVNQLSGLGYRTVHKIAREYFDCELAKGRKIDDILSNIEDVDRILMQMQYDYERALNPHELVFLDRAIPDSLTFLRFAGVNPEKYMDVCFHYKYAAIYILDMFPIERDGVRTEGDEMRNFLDTWIPRDYSALGYDLVQIPVMNHDERLEFLTGDLREKGIIK